MKPAAEVYLFTGPEAGEKNDAIDSIRESARKAHGDLDEYKYYASDTRFADVIAQLQNENLFSAATFIVLRGAEQIKTKDDIDLLSSYIHGAVSSPNTLILVSDENGVERKLEGLFDSEHKRFFREMFENRKEDWVRSYFKRNGFSAESEAIGQILDMVENNTEALKSECSRFFCCFDKGHTITTEDVDKILSHNREENAFTLFDAMTDKSRSPKQRFEASLEILQKIRLSRENNAVMLIAGLTYCFRQLRTWHSLNGKSAPAGDAQLKSAGFSVTKQKRYRAAASIWGPGATASILSLLAATDMESRGSGQALDDTRLTLLLYAIIIKNGIYPAEYETA